MTKVGKNSGVFAVPPRGDGNNTQQASQSKNKPNCVFEVEASGSCATLRNGNLEEFIDFKQKSPMESCKIVTKEYYVNGKLIKLSYDDNADGKPDFIFEDEYDENGKLIKLSYDNNADGKHD